MGRLSPPISIPDVEALDRALARTDVYRVLAAVFRDPDEPGADDGLELRILRSAAQRLGTSVTPATWTAIRRIVRRDERAAEHRAIFGHVVAHGCPPYETEFGRRHVFGQSQELGDIRGFYEAFGVRPRAGGERPDHIACELEFMALLALKEAVSIAGEDNERVELCRDAARAFLQDHPGRWVRALAARIGQRAPGSGYAAAAAIAATALAQHALALGALPMLLDPDDLVPILEEPDGFQFECGVDVATGDLTPPGSEP
jgi:TorA maturation chaperone TorD